MDHASRRARLVARLPELEADAFLVTRLPNVRFLTGFTGSNGQLLLTADGGVFLTDGRYTEQARHEVPDLRRAQYTGELGLVFADLRAELDLGRVAFEAAGVTYKTYQGLSAAGGEMVPTSDEVERLRWVKAPEELAHLEDAQAVADDAFEVVVGKLAEGMTEREVAFELDTAMRRGGAEAVSFETIVAFGESGAEPHHNPGPREVQRGDVVKIDFGSVVDGYHSDMTRTVAFGPPSPRLREVYELVRRAQQAGVEAVRAGVTCSEVDRATREPIREAGYGEQYRHPVGHGVGLEIHGQPWLRQGNDEALPEGAVVTVEPGVYLDGEGGVRIEDMVEVTADGCRVIPRTTKELVVLDA